MTPAAWTELLDRELFGLPLLVFARGVVASLATVTLKSNQVSHCLISLFEAAARRLNFPNAPHRFVCSLRFAPLACPLFRASGTVVFIWGGPLLMMMIAHEGNRTLDLFLTKEVLYRLSYVGRLSFTLAAARGVIFLNATRGLVCSFRYAPLARPLFRASGAVDFNWSGKRDSNPRPQAWKARALPTELFPPAKNHLVERGGFEPPKASPADLQSAPFDHSGTSPYLIFYIAILRRARS